MEDKIVLSWNELSAWYLEKIHGQRRKKLILNKVSGVLVSGSLVAVMGASGVGKTTLLATLADKEGAILLNDTILEQTDIHEISNYVHQKDIITESLTVSEHMKFMGAFKVNKTCAEREALIENILYDLNLDDCKATYIKNLSGGERKRVSLAVELLNDPVILFCDEPTSGLDSCNAISIIRKLKDRATAHKLVILTIHQPSSQIFEYFTHIILLANAEIAYQGTREAAAAYFESMNLRCPRNYNPAEFYIRCISMNQHDKSGIPPAIEDLGSIKKKKIQIPKREPAGLCKSIYWLVWRAYLDTKRNIGYHMFQTLLLTITAFLLASFYSSVETDDEHSVQNIKGILYFFTSELIFTHTYNVVNTFPAEYSVIMREKPLYSTCAYFISKIIIVMPRNLIQPLIFLAINFLLVGFLSGFGTFLRIYLIIICACSCGSMLGLCISAFFTNLQYMDLFVAPFELLTMLAAGILINVSSGTLIEYFKYLSPFYYTYESLSILHWNEVIQIDCRNTSGVCYGNGTQVLEELGFRTDNVYILWDIACMLILSCGLGLSAFSAIHYKRYVHSSY